MPGPKAKPVLERFEQCFERGGVGDCWEWKKSLTTDGYGRFKAWKKNWRAHRMAYELYVGDLLPGKMVCHRCHNKICVNPNHLYQGDELTNARDERELRARVAVWDLVNKMMV